MGLDMYGYTMNAEFVGDRQTDVNVSEDERDEAELNQFAYWRKFNHLHNWMEKLYRQLMAFSPTNKIQSGRNVAPLISTANL